MELNSAAAAILHQIATQPRILTSPDEGGPSLVLIPHGYTATNIERYLGPLAPKFPQGTVRLHDIPSLVLYLQEHISDDARTCLIYADVETSTITAILDDLGGDDDPSTMGRRVHRAVLVCAKDPAFLLWESLAKEPVGQRAFVRFIELNESHFHQPSGAQMRTLAASLELKKNTHFINAEKLDGAARGVSLKYESETKQVGEIQFPDQLQIRISIYRHQDKGVIPVKVHFDLESGEVKFTLRIPDITALLDAAWDQIFGQLQTALKGIDIPILKGGAPAAPQS